MDDKAWWEIVAYHILAGIGLGIGATLIAVIFRSMLGIGVRA